MTALVFLAVAGLPCWVVLVIAAVDALRGAVGGRRGGAAAGDLPRLVAPSPTGTWRERRRLARLDRAVGPPPDDLSATAEVPPIEEVAADLRRLGRQRTGPGSTSTVWFMAVQRAYDDRLRLACRELGIDQYLSDLNGVDLEIERVRVEGELQAAGVRLYSAGRRG